MSATNRHPEQADLSVRNRHPRLFASTTLFHRALRAISTNHFQAPVRRFILELFDVQLTPHTLARLAHMERGGSERTSHHERKGSHERKTAGHKRSDSRDSTGESRRRSQSSPGPEPRFERLTKLDEVTETREPPNFAAPAEDGARRRGRDDIDLFERAAAFDRADGVGRTNGGAARGQNGHTHAL